MMLFITWVKADGFWYIVISLLLDWSDRRNWLLDYRRRRGKASPGPEWAGGLSHAARGRRWRHGQGRSCTRHQTDRPLARLIRRSRRWRRPRWRTRWRAKL